MTQQLAIGNLRCALGHAEMRDIALAGEVVLDRLYFAVRDSEWATLPLTLGRPVVRITATEWSVVISGQCVTAQGALEVRLSFSGDSNTLKALMRCVPSTDIRVNRIGFCLHPMKLAGRTVEVRTADAVQRGWLPERISPGSPFTDMTGMSLSVGRYQVNLTFDGDLFETEDQRNWIDASFKTFSTPLSEPHPRTLRGGVPVEQAVTLRWTERADQVGERVMTLTRAAGALPAFGLGASRSRIPLRPESVQLLSRLPIKWLAVTLLLYTDWMPRWLRAVNEAERLRVPLDVSIVSGRGGCDEAELSALLSEVPVHRLQGYDQFTHVTTEFIADSLNRIRRRAGQDIRVAGGSRANFAELNRTSTALPLDLLDEVVFAANPQVHAFDEESILQTPAALEVATAQALDLAQGLPVVVAPLTLRPTFNAASTSASGMESPADQRQHSALAGAWAREAMAAARRASGITVYETSGPWGILDDSGRPSPSFYMLGSQL